MKRIPIFILFGVMVASGMGLAAEEYTLEEYLHKVETGNPELILSLMDNLIARETEKQARSLLLPTVGSSLGYNRNVFDIEKPTAVASLPGGGPLIWQDVDQNMDNELTFGVGLQQKLFSPEAIAKYKGAKTGSDIQVAMTGYTRAYVLTVAKKLYAQVQLAQELYLVRRDAEKTAEQVYQSVERKFNAGSVAELDLRAAEVEWKKAVSATAEAKKNSELVVMSFKTLAGLPLENDVNLVENAADIPELPMLPVIEDVLTNRYDYRAQILADKIASISQKAAYASFLPEITGSISCAVGQLGNGSGFDDYSYEAMIVGLNVQIPLYTGGYRFSLIEKANLQKKQSEVRIQQKQDEIAKDLVAIRLRMEEAQKSIASAKAIESVAQRASVLAQTSFDAGLGTRLAVSEANTNLLGARLNLENAIYSYRAAWYDWEFATGQAE